MHLCAELTAAFWTLEPFGEIGANFSLQLSSRRRFDKINKKNVIAENQCEKHKKSSLGLTDIENRTQIGKPRLCQQLLEFKKVHLHCLVPDIPKSSA